MLWAALLLVLHAGLATWAATRTSVTFDENFHLPAGVMIVTRGDFTASVAQPPLARMLYALPALAAGARLPSAQAMASGDEGTVGESFMRVNADRYVRVFLAARLLGVLFSVLLGALVWRWAAALYGPAGGLLALGFYALAPEALAHAGIVGMDVPTALAFTAVLWTWWRFCAAPSWRRWPWAALATAAAFLVRFSAVELAPTLLLATLAGTVTRRLPDPRRTWLGLLLLIPVVVVALEAGYCFQIWWGPLGALPFRSDTFRALAARWPGLRVPLPLPFLGGLDYLSLVGSTERIHTYLLGQVRTGAVVSYFPLALAFKWPLALLAAVLLRGFVRPRGPAAASLPATWVMGIAAAVMLVFAMFLTHLNVGVRYLLPLLPLACVWCGGWLAAHGTPRPARLAAVALVALLAVESLTAGPWWLSFFNWPSRGAGRGDRLVNDSNVDWGQGLIALREEMARRGIRRIHLTYHGTTDPALYGIASVPYLGGAPGPESDWIAVSSYYFVGLSQRMMTAAGRTPAVQVDFRPLWDTTPVARPAGCMYLFRLR